MKDADLGVSELGSTTPPPSTVDHGVPHVLLSSASLAVAMDLRFSVNDDNKILTNASFSWSHKLDNVDSACVAKSSGIAREYVISCDKGGNLVVSVFASNNGSQVAVQSYMAPLVAPAIAPTPAPTINMIVNFNITAGTARNSWNTQATMVETFIGQTLRLTNQDTIAHQLHTGGRPFAHGQSIAAGTNRDMRVAQAYTAANGNLYDHIAGANARFYMIAYDGNQLYAQNCASCHGVLASSTKAKADVLRIKNALSTVPAMSGIPTLVNLTQRQIEAIAYALGTR